jgi:hypothetical protein
MPAMITVIIISALASTSTRAAEFAVTIDDPSTETTPSMSAYDRDRRILETLSKRRRKAALFVCGMRVDSPTGRALLKRWSDAGHFLGNHFPRR